MGSRISLLLVLSIALALLISSEVAARDLAETTTEGAGLAETTKGASLDGHVIVVGGGHPRPRRVIIRRRRRCHHFCHGRCCSAAEAQALEATSQVEPQN